MPKRFSLWILPCLQNRILWKGRVWALYYFGGMNNSERCPSSSAIWTDGSILMEPGSGEQGRTRFGDKGRLLRMGARCEKPPHCSCSLLKHTNCVLGKRIISSSPCRDLRFLIGLTVPGSHHPPAPHSAAPRAVSYRTSMCESRFRF